MTSEPARNEPIDAFLARQFGDKPESRVLQDSARAGEIAKRLSMEPSPDGVYAPITHAIPDSLPPVAYVLHVWTHKCSLCNHEARHSEMFAEHHIRTGYRHASGTGMTPGSTFVRNQRPVTTLDWQVPLKVHNLTTRTVAGCHECLDALRAEILPSLPLPPVPEAIVATGGPKAAEGTSAPGSVSRGPKKPPSTDDFLV